MIRKIITAAFATSIIFVVGCQKEELSESTTETVTSDGTEEETVEPNSMLVFDDMTNVDKDEEGKIVLPQLQGPKEGDTVVTISTSVGDVKIRLFPEYAPKAVENFITHAKEGYYNGVIFHRVIKDFMIQGGDPEGTGMGGESIWGTPFENEVTPNLRNFRGALAMANAGPDTNGSQFYIVQNNSLDESSKQQLTTMGGQLDTKVNPGNPDDEATLGDLYPQEAIDEYITNGGYPMGDFSYTVFGQVYEGMDIVDGIAAVETGENDKPVSDVVINGISVSEY